VKPTGLYDAERSGSEETAKIEDQEKAEKSAILSSQPKSYQKRIISKTPITLMQRRKERGEEEKKKNHKDWGVLMFPQRLIGSHLWHDLIRVILEGKGDEGGNEGKES